MSTIWAVFWSILIQNWIYKINKSKFRGGAGLLHPPPPSPFWISATTISSMGWVDGSIHENIIATIYIHELNVWHLLWWQMLMLNLTLTLIVNLILTLVSLPWAKSQMITLTLTLAARDIIAGAIITGANVGSAHSRYAKHCQHDHIKARSDGWCCAYMILFNKIVKCNKF